MSSSVYGVQRKSRRCCTKHLCSATPVWMLLALLLALTLKVVATRPWWMLWATHSLTGSNSNTQNVAKSSGCLLHLGDTAILTTALVWVEKTVCCLVLGSHRSTARTCCLGPPTSKQRVSGDQANAVMPTPPPLEWLETWKASQWSSSELMVVIVEGFNCLSNTLACCHCRDADDDDDLWWLRRRSTLTPWATDQWQPICYHRTRPLTWTYEPDAGSGNGRLTTDSQKEGGELLWETSDFRGNEDKESREPLKLPLTKPLHTLPVGWSCSLARWTTPRDPNLVREPTDNSTEDQGYQGLDYSDSYLCVLFVEWYNHHAFRAHVQRTYLPAVLDAEL